MSDLETRQLRYFVAVAEELHFGRAAERLGMAQPPLSRAIRALERQLGVALLERTTRKVALTPAGEGLLHDARAALHAVTAAAHRARRTGQPQARLRLAMKADYDGGLLPRILAAYHEDPAALTVELLLGGRAEQAPALRDGRADVALLPRQFADDGLDAESLLTEPRLVALAADDPLAGRSRLRLADLAGRILPDGSPAECDGAPPAPSRGRGPGTPPAAVVPAELDRPLDLAQIFSLVELGSIVWFPPLSLLRRHPRPGIVYRHVDDLAPLELAVAWPRESRSPAVAAFVRTACAVAAGTRDHALGAHSA